MFPPPAERSLSGTPVSGTDRRSRRRSPRNRADGPGEPRLPVIQRVRAARRPGLGAHRVALGLRERVDRLAEAWRASGVGARSAALRDAGAARTTTFCGLVSLPLTETIAFITASATACRVAALRHAFGNLSAGTLRRVRARVTHAPGDLNEGHCDVSESARSGASERYSTRVSDSDLIPLSLPKGCEWQMPQANGLPFLQGDSYPKRPE